MKESRSVLAWEGRRPGGKREITKGHEETFGDVFSILSVVVFSWVYTYVRTHQTVLFKYV